MNNIKKIFVCSLIFSVSPIVSAKYLTDCDRFYLGAELIQTNLDFVRGYGEKVFRKNPLNYNLFGGYNFDDIWGLELGYEAQWTLNKNVTLGDQDRFPGGAAIPAGNSDGVQSTFKVRYPYAGLSASYKYYRLTFQALVGASVAHIYAKQTQVAENGIPINPSGTIRDYYKTKLVPVAKISILPSINKKVSLRLSLNYQNLRGFHVMSTTPGSNAQIKLSDSYGIGLGIIYSFV